MPDQTISINFAQGLNTKVDPWQLPPGQFLSLQNAVFSIGDLLGKRNGYGFISSAQDTTSSYITTLNNNLISIGQNINSFSSSLDVLVNKGSLQPCSLSVLPIIRDNLNQIQTDSIVLNGLICITYTQTTQAITGPVTSYLYAIVNEDNGQNIIPPTAIPPIISGTISGSSRVFAIGNLFIIVSPVTVLGDVFLQYVSISASAPQIISVAQNIFAETYVPISGNPGWDGVVDPSSNTLNIAYNTTAGGQGVHVVSLLESQILAATPATFVHIFAGSKASLLSMCVDSNASLNVSVISDIIYISFFNPDTNNSYTCAVYVTFGAITTQFAPTLIGALALSNIASAAQNGSCQVFSEVMNAYSYDSAIPSHYVRSVSVSSAGTVGTAFVVIRSLGLASKAFIINEVIYFLGAFQSPFQPSYFLINGSTSTSLSPIIVAKLAYQNGGGYLTLGLPQVSIQDATASLSYLFKQNIQALNTLSNSEQTSTGGLYSQLGINQVVFEIGTVDISSIELAKDLHLSGGFLSMFDGYYPVEHNMFLFPDSIETTFLANSVKTPTGSFLISSFQITVSSATGLAFGMTITDSTNPTYIPSGSIITAIDGTTVTISKATTHAGAGDTLSIQGNIVAEPDGSTNANAYAYIVTYEWTDMQGNAFKSTPSIAVFVTTSGSASTGTITVQGPMLRLTQKIRTPVSIVIYRWSISNQNYFQVTSFNAPLLNDTTADSWSFIDVYPDSQIVGNNLLYTTGGVVPNSNGAATNIITAFDTRLALVAAEDPNTLYVSKTVVQGVPVDMSLLFSIYIAPNTGTTGSTGPITALFPLDDKLLILKRNSCFYISGVGPDNLGTTSAGCSLGNYSQPIFITSVVGCTNQKSLVLTQDGVMFQSDKGIWEITRSLEVNYVGAPVQIFNGSQVTSAKVIPNTNYVLFSLDTGEHLMWDYYYRQWGTFVGIPAISSCIYNNLHTILNPYGQIQQETPGVYVDGNSPVLIQFTTSWLNLASLQGYERFRHFYILAKYLSPHLLNINVAYDYNPSSYHQVFIQPDNFSPPTASPFGVPSPFGSPVQLEQWKVHTKQQLCQSFQLSIQEIYDPSMGVAPGAGFTMSGLNCEVLIKKASRPIRAASTVG